MRQGVDDRFRGDGEKSAASGEEPAPDFPVFVVHGGDRTVFIQVFHPGGDERGVEHLLDSGRVAVPHREAEFGNRPDFFTVEIQRGAQFLSEIRVGGDAVHAESGAAQPHGQPTGFERSADQQAIRFGNDGDMDFHDDSSLVLRFDSPRSSGDSR
ncbi:hypothetical protein SDC9_212122 [bioreactor metagenome]|uniref:Uncharacterized protein n=1 Tax=bioreactor metagenome TaxID=1076179 RepID=A0A645JMP0_9ZZZZ